MAGVYPRSGGWECWAMFKRPVSIIFIIGLIRGVLSALLAIFLWFLPLLGVSLHLH
jgi:hypothetical protein